MVSMVKVCNEIEWCVVRFWCLRCFWFLVGRIGRRDAARRGGGGWWCGGGGGGVVWDQTLGIGDEARLLERELVLPLECSPIPCTMIAVSRTDKDTPPIR